MGSAWTTIHLMNDGEREVAELLGIPFDKVTQGGLFPVAYTIGTDFRPAPSASRSRRSCTGISGEPGSSTRRRPLGIVDGHGVRQLDHELGAVSREDVLAHEHRPTVGRRW